MLLNDDEKYWGGLFSYCGTWIGWLIIDCFCWKNNDHKEPTSDRPIRKSEMQYVQMSAVLTDNYNGPC